MKKIISIVLLSLVACTFAQKRTVNLTTSPFLLIIQDLEVQADFSVNKKFTVGPVINYFFGDHATLNPWALGVAGTYLLSDGSILYNSGWFARAQVAYNGGSNSEKGAFFDRGGRTSFTSFGGMLGYQWYWRGGFNIRLGIGYAAFSEEVTINVNGRRHVAHGAPDGIFSFGYAF